MAEEKMNQLNLTVVALVALVAIVGLVALVMNAASVKTVATGSRIAEASANADNSNLAGDARRRPVDAEPDAGYIGPPTPEDGIVLRCGDKWPGTDMFFRGGANGRGVMLLSADKRNEEFLNIKEVYKGYKALSSNGGICAYYYYPEHYADPLDAAIPSAYIVKA